MKKQMMLDFTIFCFPGLYVCIEELACLSLSTWLLSGMCYLVHINICCNLFCNNYYWSIFFCNHQCSSYWYWTFNRPFFFCFLITNLMFHYVSSYRSFLSSCFWNSVWFSLSCHILICRTSFSQWKRNSLSIFSFSHVSSPPICNLIEWI